MTCRASAMWAETDAATSTAHRDSLGDDQVDGDRNLHAVHPRRRVPDARLRGQCEPSLLHGCREERDVSKLMRIDRQVAVGRVRRDREIRRAGAQVDGLCTGDDDSRSVRRECPQGVEQDTSRRDVCRIERSHHADLAPASIPASESARQERSFSVIQARSASPSAGMRPLPVRQSTATWETAA